MISDQEETQCCISNLNSCKIKTLFQPIVSIAEKRIIGFEAFSKAKIKDKHNNYVGIKDIFKTEDDTNYLYQLDKNCCNNTLARFKNVIDKHNGQCLFINICSKSLRTKKDKEHFLFQSINDAKLKYENIVIEISQKYAAQSSSMSFIEACRQKNIQISIDKVELNSKLISILSKLRPDYIKLQTEAWEDSETRAYYSKNIELILNSCAKTNCTPIAIGVENEDKAIDLLKNCLYYHQGYYYTRSKNDSSSNSSLLGSFTQKIKYINSKFKNLNKEKIKIRKEYYFNLKKQINIISSLFRDISYDEINHTLKKIILNNENIISVFVINENGIQITDRIISKKHNNTKRVQSNLKLKGTDHSLEDYFLHILMGYENFTSTPHPSPISRKNSILVSIRFFIGLNNFYLLCIEFPSID